MANHDAPAGSLSQKVERYFSLLMLFINGQSMVSNDVNRWQTDFWPPNHWRIIFPTMSPLFSQMSPLFLEPWDIVPSYEISRQNTDCYFSYKLWSSHSKEFAPSRADSFLLEKIPFCKACLHWVRHNCYSFLWCMCLH